MPLSQTKLIPSFRANTPPVAPLPTPPPHDQCSVQRRRHVHATSKANFDFVRQVAYIDCGVAWWSDLMQKWLLWSWFADDLVALVWPQGHLYIYDGWLINLQTSKIYYRNDSSFHCMHFNPTEVKPRQSNSFIIRQSLNLKAVTMRSVFPLQFSVDYLYINYRKLINYALQSM